jgi:hypothetical protein
MLSAFYSTPTENTAIIPPQTSTQRVLLNFGEGVEGHEGRVDDPFILDDAGVEDDKSRHALAAHESRKDHALF